MSAVAGDDLIEMLCRYSQGQTLLNIAKDGLSVTACLVADAGDSEPVQCTHGP